MPHCRFDLPSDIGACLGCGTRYATVDGILDFVGGRSGTVRDATRDGHADRRRTLSAVDRGRTLILGHWSHQPFSDLEPFIASLQHNGFNGDLCVFTDVNSAERVRMLLAHGISVEPATRFVTGGMDRESSRYFNYLDYLARQGHRYDHVMLADLFDVVFQSDPFASPLPADVIFIQEHCRIGDSPEWQAAITSAYGPLVAGNLRHSLLSSSAVILGTVFGVLRYLTEMNRSLSSVPFGAAPDVARCVHNYLVHMSPIANAWLDTTDSLVAVMDGVPEEAVQIDRSSVLIAGKCVPVLCRWKAHPSVVELVHSQPQFRLSGLHPVSQPSADAVICFYHRDRDAEWLVPFLDSLRGIGFAGGLHCIGDLDAAELSLLQGYGCDAHVVRPIDRSLDVQNTAHLYISQLLDRLAGEAASAPDQVLALDSVRSVFLRDPFRARTIGLSTFLEGPTRIMDSEYNLHRLALFTSPEPDIVARPIVSSAILRGRLPVLRDFYRRLFGEFIGRAELLRMDKSIQGAVNKLVHGGYPGAPIIQHPNGGEAYFEIWQPGLPATLEPDVRIAGTVPFLVSTPVGETDLMRRLRARLANARRAAESVTALATSTGD